MPFFTLQLSNAESQKAYERFVSLQIWKNNYNNLFFVSSGVKDEGGDKRNGGGDSKSRFMKPDD